MKLLSKKYFLIIFVFFLFPSFFGPEMIASEMKNRFSALADDIVISGKVLAPPIKPILIGEAICDDNKLSVQLDWPTDENSDSFDIKKNGALLITNLANSSYEDIDVTINTSISYQVIAHGPMGPGSSTSDEITVITPTECSVTNPPIIQEIKTLNNSPLGSFGETPKTDERRPFFSGKTNIPNAKIEIVLDGSPKIYQTIFANANGFWTWQSPEALDYGLHTLFTTAIDPSNPLTRATDDFQFEVYKKSSNDKDKKNTDTKKNGSKEFPSSYIPGEAELLEKTSINAPFQMEVIVQNFNHRVFAGEKLSLQIDFSKKASFLEDKKYQIFYEIINSNHEIIYVDYEYLNILRTEEINKKISLSALAPTGDYRIRVKIYDGKTLIAGENFFSIHELPLINIGFCQLSLTELISNFAWLFIIILMIFLFLLAAERHRSEEGIYRMTEHYLKKSGFFSRKND